jgi:hypothetical protein
MPPLAYFGIESTVVTLVIDLLILFVLLLWLASVYWTYADSHRRIEDSMLTGLATVVALVPFVGTMLYLVVRPAETLDDARERELEFETTKLQLHELESKLCPHCDYPIESDYVRCPSCLRKLKDRCAGCSRPLEKVWSICPYCETEVAGRREGGRRPARGESSRPQARPAAAAQQRTRPAPAAPQSRQSGDERPSRPAASRPEPEPPRGKPAPARPDARSRPAGA